MATGARIDRDGSFEFPNVPPGEYVVQARKGRSSSLVEGEFGSLFVAMNGTDVTGVVLRTSPGGTISGHITLDGGTSINPREIDLSAVPVDPDVLQGDAWQDPAVLASLASRANSVTLADGQRISVALR